MANLRTKYFSKNLQNWIEVNTSKTADINTFDIIKTGSSDPAIESERIRLIAHRDDLNSTELMKLVADLLYNDIQTYNQSTQLGRVLSDGVFKNVKDAFDFEILEMSDTPAPMGQIFIDSFAIKEGLLCKNQETYLYKHENRIKNIELIFPVSTLQINVTDGTSDLTVGMSLASPIFAKGTEIVSIDGPNLITINNEPVALPSSSTPVIFENKAIFRLGRELDDLTDGFEGFRRDLIEFNVKTGQFNIIKGRDNIVRPAINSKLDSLYIIESIEHNLVENSNIFRVHLSVTVDRKLNEDFSINEVIKLDKTVNNEWDGNFTIIDMSNDPLDYWIDIIGIGRTEAGFNQVERGGFLETNYLPLYSVLIYRANSLSPAVILDTIDRIFDYAGLDSGVNEIYKATLEEDEFGLFSIKTKDRVHLTDTYGRWLEWLHGQSQNDGFRGYSYNEDDIENISNLQTTQLPFTPYDKLNEFSLVNIPFKMSELQDNIFGSLDVNINKVNLAVKNDITNIGDESIQLKIMTAEPKIINGSRNIPVAEYGSVGNVSDIILEMSGEDLNDYSIVSNDDFILVTEGPGKGQLGKILEVSDINILKVEGLLKPLTEDSVITIFNNSTATEIPGSETELSNAQVKSKALSTVDGDFFAKQFSKIGFTFDAPIIIDLDKWYFIKVRAKLEGTTWGNSPYIVIQNTTTKPDVQSAFVEVFYESIAFGYPSEYFLIEDELGDINSIQNSRDIAPHFRPVKYNLRAQPLDIRNPKMPKLRDEVFVDVQSGKIQFHPLAKPRKLFVSYFKKDILNGDSTDFTFKHVDPLQTKQVNLQDKITDIDNNFKKGSTFKKSIQVDGIIQKTLDGFKGPFTISNVEPFEVKYLESYDNHFVDKTRYNLKLNKMNEYNIVQPKVNSTVIREGFVDEPTNYNGVAIVNYSNSDTILPSFDTNNKILMPTNETFDLDTIFMKPWNKPAFASDAELHLDSSIVNPIYSVDGTWSNFKSEHFNDYNVLQILLRKQFTENLPYIASIEAKRKWKQRFVVKNVDSFLEDYVGSETQVVSERYMTDIEMNKSGFEHVGENFVFPYTQITKFTDFNLINTEQSNLTNKELVDMISSTNFFDTLTTKDFVYLGYRNPDSGNTLVIKQYQFTRVLGEPETNEFTDIEDTTISYNGVDEIIDFKLVEYDEELLALLVFRNDGGINRLELSFLRRDTLETFGTTKLIKNSLPSTCFYEMKLTKPNTLVIAYKESVFLSSFNIISYDKTTDLLSPGPTYGITIRDVTENIVISRFSRNNFLIGFTDITGTYLRIFTNEGISDVFTTDNELVLDSTPPDNGRSNLQLLEMKNNNICIVYKSQVSTIEINTVFKVLNEWDRTIMDELTFIENTETANITNQFELLNINDDTFVFKRLNISNIIFSVYQTDLILNKTIETSQPDYTLTKIDNASDNSFGLYYFNMPETEIRLDLMEYRPVFENEVEVIENTNNQLTSTMNPYKTLALKNNQSIITGLDVGAFKLIIFESKNVDNSIDVVYDETTLLVEGGNVVTFDVQHIYYESDNGLVNYLLYNMLIEDGVNTKNRIILFDIDTKTERTWELDDFTTINGSLPREMKVKQLGPAKFIAFYIMSNDTIRYTLINFSDQLQIGDEIDFNSVVSIPKVLVDGSSIPFVFDTDGFDFLIKDEYFIPVTVGTTTKIHKFSYSESISSSLIPDLIDIGTLDFSDSIVSNFNMFSLQESEAITIIYNSGAELRTKLFDYDLNFIGTFTETIDSLVDLNIPNSIITRINGDLFNITFRDAGNLYCRLMKFDGLTINYSSNYLIPSSIIPNNFIDFSILTKTDERTFFVGEDSGTWIIQEIRISPLSRSLYKDVVLSDNGKKLNYICANIKLCANNFAGKLLTPFVISKTDVTNIDSPFYNSRLNEIPFSFFKKDESNFTIVYQDLEGDGSIKMRDYTIIGDRFFIDSDTYYFDFFDFDDEYKSKNTYLHALKKDKSIVYVFKNPVTNRINKFAVNEFNNIENIEQTPSELTGAYSNDVVILNFIQLIENKSLLILKDGNNYYTYLLDEHLNQINGALPFQIEEFEGADAISIPNADTYANVIWYYKKDGDLNYKIHGINGTKFGVCQIVGRWNYLVE